MECERKLIHCNLSLAIYDGHFLMSYAASSEKTKTKQVVDFGKIFKF